MKKFRKIISIVLYPVYLVGIICIGIYWAACDNDDKEILIKQ